MNPKLAWYVSRSAGIVAWVLLALSVAWGLLLSTKLLGRRPPPAWLLDLHRFLGGLAIVFTGVHLAGLVGDNWVHFGLADLFLPFAADWKSGAVAWGIAAFYLLVAVEITSLVMRRLPRRLWRAVHFTSFAALLAGGLHGAAAGTDATDALYRGTSVALVSATMFLTLVRVLAPRRARRAARAAGRHVEPVAA